MTAKDKSGKIITGLTTNDFTLTEDGVAQIIKFAVSRQREYLADVEGAKLTRYPPGLASALRKIAGSDHAMRSANNATAHLWLDQPSRVPGERMSFLERLFATHPPIQDRIRILEEM